MSEGGNWPIPRIQGTVRVSVEAHNHIAELELAMADLVRARTNHSIDAAYANLNQRRKELYEYIEVVESRTPIKRSIRKRF